MAHNAAAAVDHGEGIRMSSRCVTEGATHDFEVTNYPLLEGMGVGRCISSSTFTVGGYDWNVRFYPDGDDEDSAAAGKASAFLCYLSPAKDVVMTSVTFTMLDDQGNVQATRQLSGTFSPGEENDTWGFGKFVEISKLKSSPRLLTIRCVLAVIKEPHAECKSNLIVDPPPELPGRLERALKNGRGTDITLLVGSREFNAHRFMLAAQSMVFDAQFFGPMMDKDTRFMEIVDMEPAIFEMLLHYVYTDSLPSCSDGDYDAATLQHLLVAAVRYGLDRLKVMCEGRLCKSIDVDTITSTLALANQHYCERLKKACLEFLLSSREAMVALMKTDGFQHLMASCPMLELHKSLRQKLPIKRKYPSS